uniref:Uncharacterized protein n=1 Tax=Glossina palpalis gambiensis TaxID=67801 RepID=A0A1B0BFE1_9MUSC
MSQTRNYPPGRILAEMNLIRALCLIGIIITVSGFAKVRWTEHITKQDTHGEHLTIFIAVLGANHEFDFKKISALSILRQLWLTIRILSIDYVFNILFER